VQSTYLLPCWKIIGFIITSKMQTWTDDFYSLRLSQILDLYYSDEGITLFESSIKICDRKIAFSHAVPKTLLHEEVLYRFYMT